MSASDRQVRRLWMELEAGEGVGKGERVQVRVHEMRVEVLYDGQVELDVEQRWMPVEEHRLFASAVPPAPPVQAIAGPPPVRAVPPVEAVEEVEEISAAPAARPDRRPARRPRPAPVSGGGGKAVVAVVGVLVVGAIAVMASKGGSKDTDRTGGTPPSTTTSAPPVIEPPKPTRKSKEAVRARWEKVHQEPDGKIFTALKGMIWLTDTAAVKAKIESVSGKKPDRTQTIGGRNYWYFECADGLIQLVWWQDGIFNYTVNDY